MRQGGRGWHPGAGGRKTVSQKEVPPGLTAWQESFRETGGETMMGGATLQLSLLNYVFWPVFKPKPREGGGIAGPSDVFLSPVCHQMVLDVRFEGFKEEDCLFE